MQKPIIAVDLDDVLTNNAQAFADFSNATWGTNLTADDFDEDWNIVWGTEIEETQRRAELFHSDDVFDGFMHKEDALNVLTKLHKNYTLVIATSRREVVRGITESWLERHYAGLFSGVYFTGFFDGKHGVDALKKTKKDLVIEIGADYLIDDQPKHCFGAAEAGLRAVLFGDYRWNQVARLPKGITRCSNWPEVGQYFDAIRE